MFIPPGFGWLPDLPDARDYLPGSQSVQQILLRLSPASEPAPPSVDLREFFPGVRRQKCRNSGCAHACVGLVEYFQRRLRGELAPLSARFVYSCSRTLMQLSGDVPTGIRATLKAVRRFGIPPDSLWSENVEGCDTAPPVHLFSFASGYCALVYVRLDGRNATGRSTLQALKAFMAAGFPVVFGFPVPDSITADPEIAFRPTFDASVGGQAVIAVGYDDAKLGSRRGALLIRNSWGEAWGEHGYGWLPYGFIEQQLACSCWTLLNPNWLDDHELQRPPLSFATADGPSLPQVAPTSPVESARSATILNPAQHQTARE